MLPSSIVDPLPESSASPDSLTQWFTDQVKLGTHKIPPEPGVSIGKALQYSSWKSAFNVLIDSKRIPEGEKLYYLRQYLGGVALESIEGYLLIPIAASYLAARKLLEECHGDPCTKANIFQSKLQKRSECQSEKGWLYVNSLQQCVLAMSTNSDLNMLNDKR